MSKKTQETIILVGIPASGKTTWANDFLAKNDKFIRLSRDEMRFAWQNRAMLSNKLESMLATQLEEQAGFFLSQGFSLIIDATNLKHKYIERWIEVCQPHSNVRCQVFDISLAKALERNAARDRVVPENIVRNMFKSFEIIKEDPIVWETYRKCGFQPDNDFSYYPADANQPSAYVVDLDGTLAWNTGNRRDYFDDTKYDLDDLNEALWCVIDDLATNGNRIVICSGRMGTPEGIRTTEKWLKEKNVPYDKLVMRKNKDYRKDNEVKEELYVNEIAPFYNVIGVFDDRRSVIDMWKSYGLQTYQVSNKAW